MVQLSRDFLQHQTDTQRFPKHREQWAALLPLAIRYPTEIRAHPDSRGRRWTLLAESARHMAETGHREFAVAVDLAWRAGRAVLVTAFTVDREDWRAKYATWPVVYRRRRRRKNYRPEDS